MTVKDTLMKQKLATIFATYFGLGLSKYAPGTMGSLGTLPLAYLIIAHGGFGTLLSTAIAIFALGVPAADVVIKQTGDDDPSRVVIDETVGQLLTFTLICYFFPQSLNGIESWWLYLLGFALFRFFDILKMGPVKYADSKIKNAYGVMLDDFFAGIFASIVLYAIYIAVQK
jgi:phosphatidylglycerophosphatase A